MPTLPTLDDFNRANGAPGSNWALAISTWNVPNIVSNALDWPTFPSLYWTPTTFAADQGCQVQLPGTAENVYLIVRLTSPGGGSESCYFIQGSYGGLGPAEAWKITAGTGTLTSLGFANGIMQSTDRWMQGTVEGSTLKIYGSSDGSAWNERQTWTDSSIASAGYIGVHHMNNVSTGTLDNFGGGALAAETGTLTFLAPKSASRW